MVKQARMIITQAEQGKHDTFGDVTKVHLEPAPSGVATSKPRIADFIVAEILVKGHDKVTVGEIVNVNICEALQ